MGVSLLFRKYFYKHFPQASKALLPEDWIRIIRIAQAITGKKSNVLIWKALEENVFLLRYFQKTLDPFSSNFLQKKVTVATFFPFLLVVIMVLLIENHQQYFPSWFLQFLELFFHGKYR